MTEQPPTPTVVRYSGSAPFTRPAVDSTLIARTAGRTASAGVSFATATHGRIALGAKRGVDMVGAVVLLAVATPLMAVVAVCIRMEGGGPVLFRQVRIGRDRRPFQIVKFRTMRPGSHAERAEDANEVEPPLFKVAADQRVTRVGRVLRRLSLDELPQLWNVLVGNMSLVGPRPPLPEEVRIDGLHQAMRLRVRPGMTGLWQVKGRSTLPYSRMVALDLDYVRRWSLRLDAWILLRTVWAVIGGRGAY